MAAHSDAGGCKRREREDLRGAKGSGGGDTSLPNRTLAPLPDGGRYTTNRRGFAARGPAKFYQLFI
jgi:hypothetical protein